MILRCSGCRRQIAKEDRRRVAGNRLFACNGARLEQKPGTAPRLVCPCGMVTIVVEGKP